jgi:hypothetical protein
MLMLPLQALTGFAGPLPVSSHLTLQLSLLSIIIIPRVRWNHLERMSVCLAAPFYLKIQLRFKPRALLQETDTLAILELALPRRELWFLAHHWIHTAFQGMQ